MVTVRCIDDPGPGPGDQPPDQYHEYSASGVDCVDLLTVTMVTVRCIDDPGPGPGDQPPDQYHEYSASGVEWRFHSTGTGGSSAVQVEPWRLIDIVQTVMTSSVLLNEIQSRHSS